MQQYEGYYARLRSDFSAAAAELMVVHRLVEHEIESPQDIQSAIDAIADNGYALSIVDKDEDILRVRVIETETSAAHNVAVPVELLGSPIYAKLRQAYNRLVDIVGQPPFTVPSARRTRSPSRSMLCARVLDAAKQGISLSRFKGLGEMNAEQLWETTMDPAKRLLMRVDVEDASAADLMFSMLMGDESSRGASSSSRTQRTSSSWMSSPRAKLDLR